MRALLFSLALGLGWVQAQPLRLVDATGQEVEVISVERIVSLDMTSTEILFALGVGPQVVARDGSSVYPTEAQALPVVGLMAYPYDPEAILAHRPTVVVGRRDLRPADLPLQLAAKGVSMVQIPSEPGVEPTKVRIRMLAELVGQKERGEALVRALEQDLAQLEPPPGQAAPSTLFVYMRGPALVFTCGRGSGTVGLLELIGVRSAAPFEECRPLNQELLRQLDPELLVVLQSGLASVGGLEGFLQLPGVAQTKAGQARRVIAVADGLSAAGGPRLGKAALMLYEAVYRQQGFVEVGDGR